MLRTDRAALLAALLALLALAAGRNAAAAGATGAAEPRIEHQAWSRTAATGIAAPIVAEPDRIYVSRLGGQEQARAYLDVDLSSIDVGPLASARVTLEVASDSVAAADADLVACALDGAIPRSGELTDDAPTPDCDVSATLSRADDGTWSFALAPFVARWSGQALGGVGIVPDAIGAPGAFVVSFDTARTALVLPASAQPAMGGDRGPVATGPAADAPATTAPSASRTAIPSAGRPVVSSSVASPPPSPAPAPARPEVAQSLPPFPDGRAGDPFDPAHPSALVLAVPVLGAAALLLARRRWTGIELPVPRTVSRSGAVRIAGWIGALAFVSALGETTIYKLGIVAIVFTAAVGLHLLVNWCGELSLAHAAFIGLPAFAVAQLSSRTGWSPLVGLPFAVLVGVALGSLVAVAALRARGLQVALVTLAFGIAAGQFLFFQRWIVGPPEGLRVRSLGSSRELVPVLAVAVLGVVVAARALMASTIGRAFLFVRAEPDAAAAAGIPVGRYRAAAYAIAGAFAGVAGWEYVVWVQQVNAKAFPLQLGFTYLVIAALAGAGGLGGVAVAALVIQGGSLFSILPPTAALYVAPVALILNVTRYPAGFNGLLRALGAAASKQGGRFMPASRSQPIGVVTIIGTLAVVAGFGAIALAWYHMGNTDQQWIQNQELMSGGVGGLALIIVGSALLVRDALLASRAPMATPASPVAAANGHRPARTEPLVAVSRS